MVANHACGQLNSKHDISPVSVCSRIWSREMGSAVPPRVSPLILHTQAESAVFPRGISSAFRNGVIVHLFIPSTAIVSIPSLSDHAVAYRWRSLSRGHRRRASNPQGSSNLVGAAFSRFTHGPIVMRISFFTPHYLYAVDMYV